MNEEKQLSVIPEQGVFSGSANFEHAQRVAKMLSSSSLIPKEFQNNIQNTLIALEMANRINASPLMVMQNLYIIHGKPSWSSTFIIASINSCRRFSTLKFEVNGEGDKKGCVAWALEVGTNERLESPRVTIEMAKKEGWYSKAGSKWQSMEDLMIRYRAAAFFGRLYAPEIMMGMQTAEEVLDVEKPTVNKVDKESKRVTLMIQDATSLEDLENLKPHLKDEHLDWFNEKENQIKDFISKCI